MTDTPSPRPTSARDNLVETVDEIKALVVAAFNDGRLARTNLNAAAHRLTELRDRLSSLRQEVRVKGLRWHHNATTGNWYAHAIGCDYIVFEMAGRAYFRLGLSGEIQEAGVSEASAKAAAQSNFEKRIRSSLEATPELPEPTGATSCDLSPAGLAHGQGGRAGEPPTPETAEVGEAKPVAWPSRCDGHEQPAFEAWAAERRYDMTEHPLHYLFLNERTSAARDGWAAGLLYAVNRMKAVSTPVPTFSITDEAVERALRSAWTDFCDANPDDLTSPEDLPNHALMTRDQFVQFARTALSAAASTSNTGERDDA